MDKKGAIKYSGGAGMGKATMMPLLILQYVPAAGEGKAPES